MKKKIKLVLNKNFYDKKAISQAIKDFEHIAKITILDDEFGIELLQKEPLEEPLKEEFSNYVLGLMKNENII
ncbi:hypothetical protein GOV04_02500 [Candidatus Woesearchaeota archaeon]|nr:hypothetical protein [Candidatus Woesearchaeota archaeon]